MKLIESHLLYAENGRIVAAFWEWRHKVMLLGVTTLGGVVALASWFYERDLRWVMCVPFVAGAIVFVLCWRFDRRIARVLFEGYTRGRVLEESTAEGSKAVWPYTAFARGDDGALDPDNPPEGSFTGMLRVTYLTLAVLMALMAVCIVILASAAPSWISPHEAQRENATATAREETLATYEGVAARRSS